MRREGLSGDSRRDLYWLAGSRAVKEVHPQANAGVVAGTRRFHFAGTRVRPRWFLTNTVLERSEQTRMFMYV